MRYNDIAYFDKAVDFSLDSAWKLDGDRIDSGNAFSRQVVDNSMMRAGLMPGDFVFAIKDTEVDPGDFVVAHIGGEGLIRQYFCNGDLVRLEAANDSYGPIIIHKDTPGFTISGKVVRVFS